MYTCFVAITVRFNHSKYKINETDGSVTPVLKLSHNSNCNVVIHAKLMDKSATGQLYTVLTYVHMQCQINRSYS